MKFSILLSVYHKENHNFLDSSLMSIYDYQTLKPTQIVLVEDGQLTEDLYNIIKKWKIKLQDTLTIVKLENNSGLATALNKGLKLCKYELVARMDTDDVSVCNRFEKQIYFMATNPNIDVSSGAIEEWDQDLAELQSKRELPLTQDDIYKFAKSRCPISHPAVIFRKQAVLEAGGYPIIYPEDYPLWGRMLKDGYKFANLPDVLVKMRVGDALTKRRGLQFLKGEIKLFVYLHNIGFINLYELYRNIIQRSIVRLSPTWLKKILYKYLR